MSRIFEYFRTVPSFAVPKAPTYAWDQWGYTDYFYFVTPEFRERLYALTGLANRALAIAIGEWIACRLSASPKHAEALEFFDAAWVTMIRRNSCEYVVLEHDQWNGPLDGVMRAAMLIVNDTVFDAEEDFAFGDRGCWSINLARYIADERDRSEFEDWLALALNRLEEHYSGGGALRAASIFDRHFDFGPPVGPTVFIPGWPYDPERAGEEVAAHERSLVGRNRFLRPDAGLELRD